MAARCTLTSIARAAKVSVSAVSYAFRGDPKIPRATAERIRRVAARLGYRPNPSVSALMVHIRAGRTLRSRERLAFVWIEGQVEGANVEYHRACLEGARTRAEELGFNLEEFRLTEPGMTPMRLSNILKARGIVGIVFSSAELNTAVNLQMDWAAHSMGIIGNVRWNPELHRAGHYHYIAMRRIMLELSMRGYQRPLALFSESVNQRANRSWESAFLAFHPRPKVARDFLHLRDTFDAPAIRVLLKKHEADAVIVTYPRDAIALRELSRRPALDIGIVALQAANNFPEIAGIDPNHQQVAANAVDLVVSQLCHNERGVPENPKEQLFYGHWMEGCSLRARLVDHLPGIEL